MAERLYLADPYLAEFDADVVAESSLGGRAAVLLDRTAFYPEGGGQPADRGTLGGVPVVDVRERDGEVLHVLAGAAPRGRVACRVDLGRRLDHMQQHHGQHLLSAAFEARRGARTLSFHLGEEASTIDLDAPVASLDRSALREAEAAANEAVFRDLEVTARELGPDEIASLPLRREPSKGSRVVVVGPLSAPFDASPCGGTHPRRTGEVGGIAILRAQKWGDGTRVEFLCGGRLLSAFARMNERLGEAARALRCAPAEVAEAAARVAEEAAARRKEVDALLAALARAEADRLALSAASGTVAVLLEPPGGGAAWLRLVAAALADRGRTALLAAVSGGRAHLCFARPRGPGPDLGAAMRAAAALLGGKGGGAPELSQGSGPEVARTADALAVARAELERGPVSGGG